LIHELLELAVGQFESVDVEVIELVGSREVELGNLTEKRPPGTLTIPAGIELSGSRENARTRAEGTELSGSRENARNRASLEKAVSVAAKPGFDTLHRKYPFGIRVRLIGVLPSEIQRSSGAVYSLISTPAPAGVLRIETSVEISPSSDAS
jgi:hypothetical protein